ncbi:MAG: class I SAM-dependent methyltransferase [Chloroflexi bacterium]|nr:class I SAM-dependent methyltransferase [Chloroflexota bacterium]
MEKIDTKNLKDISETLLLTLNVRANESQRPDAMIKDDKAVEMVKRINYDFKHAQLRAFDKATIIMRMREFDRFARNFIAGHKNPVIIHIGCGLDTRFERVAERDGKVEWYDLDLPPVIELRRELIEESEGRHHLIEASVFEDAWMENINPQSPILFIAEGVLPYFEEAQVKTLFLKISEHFKDAEFVFDAMDPFATWADNFKLKRTKMSARLHWGLKNSREIESWKNGFRLLDEWYYFDQPEPRLKSYYWIRLFPKIARSVGILHYRLG